MIRYPRKPTGPSAPGAAGVRSLQRAGGNWQTKRQLLGVTSKQMGDFQRVIVEQDGWVSAGKVERNGLNGIQVVTRSWLLESGTDGVINRRGLSAFTDLLLPTAQPRAIPENPLGYMAKGEIHKLEFTGTMLFPATAQLELRAGYLPYGSGRLIATIEAQEIPDYIPGARLEDGWAYGVAHNTLSPTESFGHYTAVLPDGSTVKTNLIAIADPPRNPRTQRPAINRVSPNELFGFVPGIEAPSTGPFGSQFIYSQDNGATWFYALDGASILTDRVGYDAMDPYAWESDPQVFEIRDRFLCAPMENGDLFIVVGEGAYNAALGGSHLRVYRIDGSTTTLMGSELEMGAGLHGTIFTKGGHHRGRPFIQVVDEENSVSKLVFIAQDGASIDVVVLPQPSHLTGRVRALSQTELQCVMYRAAEDDRPAGYYIHVSEDFGNTWEKRFLIVADDNAPPEIFIDTLKVNHLLLAHQDAFLPRENGVAADAYPGAPWIGDYTVTPPWEE